MNDPTDRGENALAQWIREAHDAGVSPEPEYARRLREAVLARAGDRARPRVVTVTRAVLCLTGVAALLVLALAVWNTNSTLSWAQVVAAVRAKAWLHATIKMHDGRQGEFWFSRTRNVSAWRGTDGCWFDDLGTNVRWIYDPAKKTLLRVPEYENASKAALSFQKVLEAMLRGDARLDSPFPDADVADQKRRTVHRAGRSWIEYELRVHFKASPTIETTIVFEVDPPTRLPQSMTFSRPHGGLEGQSEEATFIFDYPDQGPSDIYALGVPHDTPVEDRVPQGDLARVIAGVKQSRDRFPHAYLAIVTHSLDKSVTPIPEFIWCKGDSWRREYRLPDPRTPAERKALRELKLPPAGTDMVAWWKETTKGWRSSPMEICDGKWLYVSVGKTEKTEWKKEPVRPRTAGTLVYRLPDRQGYPSLPLPDYYQMKIIKDSQEGPKGILLLVAQAAVDKNSPVFGQECRYWIDPSKNYLVVRRQLTYAHPENREAFASELTVVESAAEAPNGIWYPTVLRRQYTSGAEKGVQEETWTFAVDFTSPIPDDLFRIASDRQEPALAKGGRQEITIRILEYKSDMMHSSSIGPGGAIYHPDWFDAAICEITAPADLAGQRLQIWGWNRQKPVDPVLRTPGTIVRLEADLQTREPPPWNSTVPGVKQWEVKILSASAPKGPGAP